MGETYRNSKWTYQLKMNVRESSTFVVSWIIFWKKMLRGRQNRLEAIEVLLPRENLIRRR